jgi:hypothetical protein
MIMTEPKKRAPRRKLVPPAHEIPIKVVNRRTILLGAKGEKYAMAAWKGSTVTWMCDHPFAIGFEPGSDLAAEKKAKVWEVVIPRKPQHFMYKYTIAVAIPNGRVLIMDPVLVPIPPENCREK